MSSKELAAVGGRILAGEQVAPLLKLEKDHCWWLMTVGDDMGKFLWR